MRHPKREHAFKRGDISIGFIILLILLAVVAFQCSKSADKDDIAKLLGGRTTKGDVAGKVVETTIDTVGLSGRVDGNTGMTEAHSTIRNGLSAVQRINDNVAGPAGQATFEALAQEGVAMLRAYGLAKGPDGKIVKAGDAEAGTDAPAVIPEKPVVPEIPKPSVNVVRVGGDQADRQDGLPSLFGKVREDPRAAARRGAKMIYKAFSNPDYDESVSMLTGEQKEYCIRLFVKDGVVVDHESVIQMYCDGF